MKNFNIEKILIIQTAFIGDVILSTSIIQELVRIYPSIKIDFLVRKGNESLLENQPNLNQVYILNKEKNKISQLFKLIRQFRVNKYDEIINLHRYASTGLVTILSNAKSTVGFKQNPFSFLYSIRINHSLFEGKHEVERNLECISHHGATKKALPKLFPSQKNYQKVNKYSVQTYFCLAPSSVWFTKQLPIRKWIELIDFLKNKGTVYLLGAKSDIELCNKLIIPSFEDNIINLAGELSFLDSAALMQGAKQNFVNDSGPLHICSAMNAPVTAFFCSTSPSFGFGPLSENAKIVETKHELPCKPCGIHGHKKCPLDDFKCGNTIEIDTIIL